MSGQTGGGKHSSDSAPVSQGMCETNFVAMFMFCLSLAVTESHCNRLVVV